MLDRRITVLTAVLLGAWALGCGGSDDDKPSSESAGSGTTTQATAKPHDASTSVVAVEGIYPDKKTKATGVVYDAQQGLVLTANHPIEAAPSIDVHLADGTLTHARPVARAQCHDLAVIKLFPRPSGVKSMPLGNSDEAKLGDPVSTTTYLFDSDGGKPALTRINGTVASLNVSITWAPLPKVGPLFAHQTSLSAPASGSPLIDEQGNMIALNTLVDHPSDPDTEGIEYALPANYVKKRMDELKPGSGGALGGWEAEHNECHAAMLRLIGKGHEHDPNAPAAKADEHSDDGH
jgi:S1-C subfamily serine protease